jgi:hypothetical protein
MARRINQRRFPTKPPAAPMCGSSLSRDRMSNPSGSFYGFEAISVPVQDRQIEAIAQKLVVLRRKMLLNGLQVSREGFQHRTSLR